MVKTIFPILVTLSLSITVVFGHSHHGLEKRAVATCNQTYQPVAPGSYPTLDCVPFVQDPQVQEWLKLVDLSKTPVYPPSKEGVCPTDLATIPKDQCWWTCQKCEAPGDITACPKTGTWGLTYDVERDAHEKLERRARAQFARPFSTFMLSGWFGDDGPSPDTPRLYDYLKAHNQKATLFVVGSRVASNPATLKRAYDEGHQIAIHTWSHRSMTSLSNEQIVAELKWTEKAIFDTIGVTPLYWRPPFGDVDNRVRNIATQLGYKTSIWTQGFDTNDWNIPGGTATPQSVIDTFKSWLTKFPTMSTGFIVLEHDLFPEEVDVSINGILPVAFQTKDLVIQPIAQCLDDPHPYKEGAGTFVFPPSNNTTGPGGKNSGAELTILSTGPKMSLVMAFIALIAQF
ncbi:chitin deacetylase [Entomortierella beljakovae]|nr:chitin deacetylase [Entomortierella beljakovae]